MYVLTDAATGVEMTREETKTDIARWIMSDGKEGHSYNLRFEA